MNQNSSSKITYLSFLLGKELFGANVGQILEVIKGEQITEVPRSEDFIRGIINFRGEIVPVIDFFMKIGISENENQSQDIIIIVELFEQEQPIKLGLLVDSVRKVFEAKTEEIKNVPEFGLYYNPEYLKGVIKTQEGLVSIIDLDKTLKEKDIQIIIESKNNLK